MTKDESKQPDPMRVMSKILRAFQSLGVSERVYLLARLQEEHQSMALDERGGR